MKYFVQFLCLFIFFNLTYAYSPEELVKNVNDNLCSNKIYNYPDDTFKQSWDWIVDAGGRHGSDLNYNQWWGYYTFVEIQHNQAWCCYGIPNFYDIPTTAKPYAIFARDPYLEKDYDVDPSAPSNMCKLQCVIIGKAVKCDHRNPF